MYSWKNTFQPHVCSIVLGFHVRYATRIMIICCFLKIIWFTLAKTINLGADVSFIRSYGLSPHMVIISDRSHTTTQ